MIRFLIGHFKLGQRIVAGYMLAGVISLVIVAIASLAFLETAGQFTRFVAFGKQSRLDLLATAKITEIQRQALIYTYEGHPSAAEQVDRLGKELLERIKETSLHDQPEVAAIAAIIKQRLLNYFDAFQKVKQQRELQGRLVHADAGDPASDAEALLAQLADQRSGTARQLEYGRALNDLLLAEKHAFSYFDTHDAVHVAATKASLRRSLGTLEGLAGNADPADEALVRRAADGLRRYERSFIEAVQRARGYLYLVNVVMAAEAYEILHQSRKLSGLLEDRMDATERSILSSIGNARWLLLSAGGGLLAVLVILSYAIGGSIAGPIAAIAETFRRLAAGDAEARIPAYQQADEIGQLTLAAEAFHDKNVQTEDLLRRTTELADALDLSKKDLERSNDELEQFVYTVSHDLKSPLVTSMGFIGVIRKLADQGKPEQAIAMLDKVVKANERMSQLINDLLELSRVGRIDLEKKPLDLGALLSDLARNQRDRLGKLGFTLAIQPNLPVIVANESRVLELFENVLSNALKYVDNPDGPKLEIGAAPSDEAVLVYCKDNGPGIAPEFHEKIFGLFYRLDTQREGTGIGLAIARKVMKFHGGDIWVESRPGEGATFWIKFPQPGREALNDAA